jgi:2-polyprenyl-6-methoxyphenol hydroxylase-like FAD-dependent oxidoreductase
VRHHYEGLSRFPQRFVVIGDAICSFNPVYGQGMSVAALEAQELDDVLRSGLDRIGQRFFKRAAKTIANPWLLAVGADFQFPGVQGPKPPMVDAINAYLARVHRLAHHDRRASQTFIEVLMLTRPPIAMFAPSLVWAVIQNSLPRLRGPAGPREPRFSAKRAFEALRRVRVGGK